MGHAPRAGLITLLCLSRLKLTGPRIPLDHEAMAARSGVWSAIDCAHRLRMRTTVLRCNCQPGYHSSLGRTGAHAGRNLSQVTRTNSGRGPLYCRSWTLARLRSWALHALAPVRHAVRKHVRTLRVLDPVTQNARERESAYFTEIEGVAEAQPDPLWNGARLL